MWFYVLNGNFTIRKTTFDQGKFNNILSASSGKITILDSQIINSPNLQDGFLFSQGNFQVSITNLTFFNNSVGNSFIHFDNIANSTIILSSLNFSFNNPYDATMQPSQYVYFSSGQNNTISFQNFLIFNGSVSCNILFKF